MTAAAEPTELLLIVDGDIVVVRPDDVVLLRARAPITAQTAANFVTTLQQALGRGRFAVLDNTLDIVVQRASNTDPLRARLQIVEDHINTLRCENAQLRGDLAAAYCRMDDMEGYNDD
jgi:hypothetical protein